MGPAGVSETIQVVGRCPPFVQTAQVATNFSQELISTLPTARARRGDDDGAVGHAERPGGDGSFRYRAPVLREPVPGQRRDGQREPARPGLRPVHRGRHPGARWRRPASRPSMAASAAASSTSSPSPAATTSAAPSATRCNNDNWRTMTPFEEPKADVDGADLRVHRRRPGDARPPVVLHGRPPAEAGERGRPSSPASRIPSSTTSSASSSRAPTRR